MRRFREPVYEQVALLLEAYWRVGLSDREKTDVVRTVIDTVQLGVGQTILRDLMVARAYHDRAGKLDEHELLLSGRVESLIRKHCGMDTEPGQPVERSTRSRVSERLRK